MKIFFLLVTYYNIPDGEDEVGHLKLVVIVTFVLFRSSFGGGEETEAQDETINVFSVASGHLYERFLRIMMMSVLKNTKSPVKFWFLKNYLSPSLKVSFDIFYSILQMKREIQRGSHFSE